MRKIKIFFDSKSDASKSAFVFTLAILVSRGISLISTPIFTRIMPPDQIGIVGLYTSCFLILSSITSLALNSGGFMVGLKEFSTKRDEYISSIITLTSLTTIITSIIFLSAPSFWSNLFGLPIGLIILMFFGCLVTPAYEFWLVRQRYEYSYKKASFITIITSFTSVTFAVIAIILMKDYSKNLGEIRLYVATGTTIFVYLFFWIFLLKKGDVFYDKIFWKFSLSLSIPLLGHSFASQILSVSDRLFIAKFVGNDAVGIYSTLYTVGSLALMFWGALNSSFIPYLFQNIDKPSCRQKVSFNTLKLLIGFSILTICVSIMAPEIISILAPEEYLDNISIVPPIAAGVYFIAVGNLYSNILVYCKETKSIMYSSLFACVISVVLNIILIPQVGYHVAAYNTLFSYMIFALFQSFSSIKVFKYRFDGVFIYNNRLMLLITIITVVLSLICIFIYNYFILRCLFGLLLFLSYVILIWKSDDCIKSLQ